MKAKLQIYLNDIKGYVSFSYNHLTKRHRMSLTSITAELDETIHLNRDIPHETFSTRTDNWTLMGQKFPRTEVVYFSQTIILYIIIIVSLINLTRGAPDSNLWASTLSGSLGYMLPHPKIKVATKTSTRQGSITV